MKKIIYTFFLCLLYFSSMGQQNAPANMEVTIEYDAAGNRTCRKVIILNSTTKNLITNPEYPTEPEAVPQVDIIGNIQVTAYPNPTTQKVFLHIQDYGEAINGDIYLYSSDGRFLQQHTVGASTMELDLSQYVPGIYIVKIRLNDYYSEWKIIKQ